MLLVIDIPTFYLDRMRNFSEPSYQPLISQTLIPPKSLNQYCTIVNFNIKPLKLHEKFFRKK